MSTSHFINNNYYYYHHYHIPHYTNKFILFRNILCFPIKNEKDGIVGVAQLCNKINHPFFTRADEDVAKTFSIYCCISIVHVSID